jgi:predicted CopG family antitoxin
MSAYPIKQIYGIIDKLKLDIDIIYISTDIPIQNREEIPDHSGLYIFINELGKRYIGSSISILNRQYNHHIVENIRTIDVYLIENVLIARKLEEILIFVLKPELNMRGKCWMDKDEDIFNHEKLKEICTRPLKFYLKHTLTHDNEMVVYKSVIVKEEVHNKLEYMKTKANRSFSDVIENVLKENKLLTEENKKLIEEHKGLTEILEKKQQTIEKYKIDM